MKKIVLVVILLIFLGGVGISRGAFGIDWQKVGKQVEDQLAARMVSDVSKSIDTSVRIVSEESVVIDVVDKISPSVVTVGVEHEQPVYEYEPSDPFGFFQIPRQKGTRLEEADIGSGFIIAHDGLIVTNRHVVDNHSYKYKVITSDNNTYDVEKIYRDPKNDIAILKIHVTGLTPVELGDSDRIKVGQTVIAMGTPLGEFRGSVTKGIVSGVGRGIHAGSPFEQDSEEIENVIQTDAAINPGNSGGPLVNSAGQVIGVNTAIASGAENIGFALPINLIKDALKNFEETGSFDRAFLGVSYQIVTRELSIMNTIPEGAYVVSIVSGSAAEKAGVQKGDIITHFNGSRINESNGLTEMIGTKKTGDTVTLKVWRDGEDKDLSVTLGDYEQ